MIRFDWLSSAALLALATPAIAQEQAPPAEDNGEIIVTATRRATSLSDTPIAISAIGSDALARSGASDLRGLNQLSPSLLVSSTSSEAVGGVARIRGIGTVGDNPGLESSVATFVDGVYRSRSGVALTELGAVDRIEVLRGPQGTLFGRNASAGLINVVTAAPSFDFGGNAELSYGNYDYWRAAGGITGPISEQIAFRLDGVLTKRDGFLRESNNYAGASDRDFNNRDRWLLRGQLLIEPSDSIKLRLIADYARRDEQCCAATYLPARNVVRASDGSLSFTPNSFAALLTSLGGIVNQDIYARRVSVTPGRDYASNVREGGISGELNWQLGGATLTAISAYRDWRVARGQDADFGNLDIFYRDALRQRFKTFTQEVRFQGKALDGKLDWLVGGYYGHETLTLDDNLRFGSQFGLVQGCRVASGVVAAGLAPAGSLAPGQPGCLTPAGRTAFGGVSATLLAGLDRLTATANVGASADSFRQTDETWALFTHNVLSLTDRLSLTLGARYTRDTKTLDAKVVSDGNQCAAQRATLGALAAGGNSLAATMIGLTCANNTIGGDFGAVRGVDGAFSDRVSDGEWTGTAVLAFKPIDRLMTYASYSKGFKAGGFNLDRAGLILGNPAANQLRFAAEKVDAFELGAKYRGRDFRLAVAGFYQLFDHFQLNTFNGTSFIVESISGCSTLAGGDASDRDLIGGNSACTGKRKSGVISKGVEVEASLYPAANFSVDLGMTIADTKYRANLVGAVSPSNATGSLPTALFLLPGQRLSNAPLYTVTGGASWTPKIGARGVTGLLHADFRYQSAINAGSDLLPEKAQQGVMTINARIGLNAATHWGIELWAQNLLDTDYVQTVAGAPIQGSGSYATVAAGGASPANGLFIVFPAEPRTWGATIKYKF